MPARNAVDSAADAIKNAAHPRIHIFLSSSEIHLVHQLKKSRDEIIEMACANVTRAKKLVDDIEFSPMDASRTDPAYLYKLIEEVIKCGATTINVPDTVGYAIPGEFRGLDCGYFQECAEC
jgi:2-isopropylmalate synthase